MLDHYQTTPATHIHRSHAGATAGSDAIVLPPYHPDHLNVDFNASRRLRAAPGALQQVFSADNSRIVTVPGAAVLHCPRPGLHLKKLTICQLFDAENPSASCAKGMRCKYVHTALTAQQLDALPSYTVHEGSLYRDRQSVPYPLLSSSAAVVVADTRGAVESTVALPGDQLLATRGALRWAAGQKGAREAGAGAPIRRCAHFHHHQCCHLGPDCEFAHVVAYDRKRGRAARGGPNIINATRSNQVKPPTGFPDGCLLLDESHLHELSSQGSAHDDADAHSAGDHWLMCQHVDGRSSPDSLSSNVADPLHLPHSSVSGVSTSTSYPKTLPLRFRFNPYCAMSPVQATCR